MKEDNNDKHGPMIYQNRKKFVYFTKTYILLTCSTEFTYHDKCHVVEHSLVSHFFVEGSNARVDVREEALQIFLGERVPIMSALKNRQKIGNKYIKVSVLTFGL